MADQHADDTDAGASGVGDSHENESKLGRGRLVTDGGAEIGSTQVDPDELDAHPKNSEIYGDDPELDGLVTDMEADGYDPGNPLTVNPDQTVVKGHRRWRAALEAGIDNVPVIEREFDSEDDEEAALLLDNLLQRDQSFSQKMREAAELERLNDEGEDQGVRAEVVEEFLNSGEGRTRDRVAAAVGLGSGETYRRAKRVWEAAEDDDEEAVEQVEQIDTGEQSIHGAFTALQDDPEPEDEDHENEATGTGSDDEATTSTSSEATSSTDSSDTGAEATDESGDTGAEEGGGGETDEPVDVSDEDPPSPGELDDRDDPADEVGMGRSEGGGVGEDAGKTSAELAEEANDADEFGGSEGGEEESPGTGTQIPEGAEHFESDSPEDDGKIVSEDDLVVEGEMAEEVRERAEERDQDPEEMLNTLINEGKITDGESESDDGGDDDSEDEVDEGDEGDGEGVLANLDDDMEEEVRSRARELDLEPEEVINRLVGAWVEGDDAPFETA